MKNSDENRGPNLQSDTKPDANLPVADLQTHPNAGSGPLPLQNPVFLENNCCQVKKSAPALEVGKNGGEKMEYDPYEHGNARHPTSFWGTVFHVVIIIAGPALLSVPSAFVIAGYVTGCALVAPVAYLYAHNVRMMVWSEYELCKMKRVPNLSYQQVTYEAFSQGPEWCRFFARCSCRVADAVFFIIWFSFYCYNYVVIGQNLQVLFRNSFRTRLPINAILLALLVPHTIFAWIRKLKYLVPFSLFGNFCNFLSLLFIVYFTFADATPWQMSRAFGQLSNLPLLVGALFFNLNIAGFMMPLKNEMRNPRQFLGPFGVLSVSFVPTTFLYALFSTICALKYGDSIKPSVIENLPEGDLVAQVGIFLSCLAVTAQQPLLLYVPFDVIRNKILKKKFDISYKGVWESALRTFLVVLAFGVSVAVPNVFLFLSLSGTIGTSIDSLVLPALVHSIVTWKVCESKLKFRLTLVKNTLIIILALMLVVSGCVDCVNQIILAYADKNLVA